MARAALAAAGIGAVVAADDAGGAYVGLQGGLTVRLLVAAEDLPDALEVLRAEADPQDGDADGG
ncbi:MAG: DUF2007 domain-containing protein [Gemmatimonadales bacterium]